MGILTICSKDQSHLNQGPRPGDLALLRHRDSSGDEDATFGVYMMDEDAKKAKLIGDHLSLKSSLKLIQQKEGHVAARSGEPSKKSKKKKPRTKKSRSSRYREPQRMPHPTVMPTPSSHLHSYSLRLKEINESQRVIETRMETQFQDMVRMIAQMKASHERLNQEHKDIPDQVGTVIRNVLNESNLSAAFLQTSPKANVSMPLQAPVSSANNNAGSFLKNQLGELEKTPMSKKNHSGKKQHNKSSSSSNGFHLKSSSSSSSKQKRPHNPHLAGIHHHRKNTPKNQKKQQTSASSSSSSSVIMKPPHKAIAVIAPAAVITTRERNSTSSSSFSSNSSDLKPVAAGFGDSTNPNPKESKLKQKLNKRKKQYSSSSSSSKKSKKRKSKKSPGRRPKESSSSTSLKKKSSSSEIIIKKLPTKNSSSSLKPCNKKSSTTSSSSASKQNLNTSSISNSNLLISSRAGENGPTDTSHQLFQCSNHRIKSGPNCPLDKKYESKWTKSTAVSEKKIRKQSSKLVKTGKKLNYPEICDKNEFRQEKEGKEHRKYIKTALKVNHSVEQQQLKDESTKLAILHASTKKKKMDKAEKKHFKTTKKAQKTEFTRLKKEQSSELKASLSTMKKRNKLAKKAKKNGGDIDVVSPKMSVPTTNLELILANV